MNPEGALYATYAKHPRLAADKAVWHRQRAAECQAQGQLNYAVGHHDRADALEAVLDRLERCRKCGRPLEDPESVALKIGPTCRKKEGVIPLPAHPSPGVQSVS